MWGAKGDRRITAASMDSFITARPSFSLSSFTRYMLFTSSIIALIAVLKWNPPSISFVTSLIVEWVFLLKSLSSLERLSCPVSSTDKPDSLGANSITFLQILFKNLNAPSTALSFHSASFSGGPMKSV